MAIENQASQRAYLRRAVGHNEDTALISDNLLDDSLSNALREINQHFPLRGFGSFATVKNQQVYNPVPATGYALTKVFWPAECEYAFPQNLDVIMNQFLLTEVVDEWGTRRTYEPSIVLGWYQNQEFFDRLYGNGGYIENEVSVYLDPIPASDGMDVYFNFTKERYATVEDVADIHVQPYYACALAHLHEALAAGRGGLIGVNSAGGVGMQTIAPQQHLKLSDRMRKKFESYLPVIKPGRHWP